MGFGVEGLGCACWRDVASLRVADNQRSAKRRQDHATVTSFEHTCIHACRSSVHSLRPPMQQSQKSSKTGFFDGASIAICASGSSPHSRGGTPATEPRACRPPPWTRCTRPHAARAGKAFATRPLSRLRAGRLHWCSRRGPSILVLHSRKGCAHACCPTYATACDPQHHSEAQNTDLFDVGEGFRV